MIILISILVVISVAYLGGQWITLNTKDDMHKLSPYECGFEPIGNSRMKYEILYYVVGLLYLIFDLELIFLLPLGSSFYLWNSLLTIVLAYSFIFIITIGFIYEYLVGKNLV